MQRVALCSLLFIAVGCGVGSGVDGTGGRGGGQSGGSGGAPSSGSGGATTPGTGGATAPGTGGAPPTGSGGRGANGSGGRGGGAGAAGGAGGQPTARSNPLSQSLIDAFVAAHNQARSGTLNPAPSPPLPPVTWDYLLADSAYNYTTRCQGANGLLSHNANRTADYRALGGKDNYVGENIYGTSGSTARPGDAVELWMEEASLYNYTANIIGDAGHYTQVVWRSSVRIGCAIVDCPGLTYHNTILCNYAPGGNITGQRPY